MPNRQGRIFSLAKEISPLQAGELPYHLRKATPDLDWKVRFRIIASKASRNNKRRGIFTKTEMPIREELINLGFIEGQSFHHQRRVFGYHGCRGQNVYFWMDLFIPSLMLDIEADGEIWHNFFGMKKRDRRRDAILRRKYGIKVIRLNSYHIRKKRLNSILARAIEKRKEQMALRENNGSNRFASEI